MGSQQAWAWICLSPFSTHTLQQAVQTQTRRLRRSPKDGPWERLATAACGRGKQHVCFPAAWGLPALGVFALLSSCCLLWKVGHLVALSPGALGGSGSRPEEASGTSQSQTEVKGRATEATMCRGSWHARPLLRV